MALAVSMALAGCGASGTSTTTPGSSDSGSAAAKVKIFIMAPQSGGSASLGQSLHNGARLAFEDKKADLAKAGISVEVQDFDDEGKPEVGTQLASQIADDKAIVAGVGTLNSGVAIPVSEKLKDTHVSMVSPANTANKVTDRGLANMNRVCSRDDVQGPAAAKFAKDKLSAKTVYIIHDKTAYGQPLAEAFQGKAKELGINVAGFDGINVGDTDFSAVLTKVKSSGADLVYFGGLYGEAGPMVKQMRAMGITANYLGADGLDDEGFTKLAGNDAKGVYFTTVAADPNTTDAGKKFMTDYQKRFNTPAVGYAAQAYDAAGVVIDALIRYGNANKGKTPTREDIEKAVRDTHGFQGIVTKVDFDQKGDNKQGKIFVFQFTNNNYADRTFVGGY